MINLKWQYEVNGLFMPYLQDVCAETGASSSTFVPTVTAISTSPDLQWMVQPTVLTSDTPSPGRNQPRKVHGALQSSHRAGGCKRQSTGKKEHKKQVLFKFDI